MDWIVIDGAPPYDGRYMFDLAGQELTTREWGWIKRLSGYLPLTLDEGFKGGDPELLDQDHLIARGIEWQHGDRMAALEHFARQLPAHAAREQPVTQAIPDDLEVAVVRDRPLEHHDPRIGHLADRRVFQVNALNAIRVNVSWTPSRVCTRLVTNRPMSALSSR